MNVSVEYFIDIDRKNFIRFISLLYESDLKIHFQSLIR